MSPITPSMSSRSAHESSPPGNRFYLAQSTDEVTVCYYRTGGNGLLLFQQHTSIAGVTAGFLLLAPIFACQKLFSFPSDESRAQNASRGQEHTQRLPGET